MMAKLIRYRCVAFLAVILCCTYPALLFCQVQYNLQVRYIDSANLLTRQSASIQTVFNSKSECDEYLVKLPSLLQSKGFIAASLDSFVSAGNNTSVYLFLGRQYQSLRLRVRPNDKPYLLASGYDLTKRKAGIFNFKDYAALVEKTLDYFEESGFPFATVSLDSIVISDSIISALLHIVKGATYRFDSVRMYGSAKISRNFIHRYLNMEMGSVFSKTKLDKINQRILELPYLQQSHPWDVTMLNTGSIVNLYLQPRKSNQVNVLAGLLPANEQLGGKLLFTIDANLRLQNAFSGGETVGLFWQQIQPKSPRLNLQFTQPYIFNSTFGVDFLFDLFKKDSAFLNINGQLGLLYMLSPTQTGKLIIQSRSSNILDTDTNTVKSIKRLPDVADVRTINLGVEYEYSNTDYKFNPRSGSELFISALAGNKTIRKSNVISQLRDTSFDFNTLYDSVKLKTYQVKLKLKAARYTKLGKQTVLKTALDAGFYQNPQYFRNDLFQIGGYKSLRGFDEESIYADRYAIGTVEYRYLIGLNSSFFAFTNVGWSQNNIVKTSNSYIGAGIGLSFETKGGIFNLSYAVGKRNDLNFDIKQSKIHFGFVSIF